MAGGKDVKIKIINQFSDYYEKEFHVSNMNYDNIIVKNKYENIVFRNDEAELIAENSFEEVIVKCKDIMKIKLKRGMPLAVYAKLASFIEDNISGDIKNIEVLSDEYKLIKKNLWEKNISAVINDKYPVDIDIVGKNYHDAIDITIENKSIEQFKEECNTAIKANKTEIRKRMEYSECYEKALKNITRNYS